MALTGELYVKEWPWHLDKNDNDDKILTSTEGGPIVDVWCLPEGAVCPAHVVVVSADHHRTSQTTLTHGLVER